MSRSAVRAYVQTFFTQPPVPGLPVVRKALEPQDQIVAQGAATPGQSFSVIYMPAGQDHRLSTPAATPQVGAAGIKLVHHEVHLQVCHYYDGTGQAAMADCDDLIEAILARLRSDARIGQSPDAVFEVAQGPGQIGWRVGETEFLNEDGEAVTWFAVQFRVTEQIQA